MIVRELTRGEEDRWDEFLRNSEQSTAQHLAAWKQVMEEVFNSNTHYLLAEENGKITGVLPLIHVNSLVVGNYVTSVPGGLCATSNDVATLLLDEATKLVKDTKARYLILRDGRNKWDFPGLLTNEEHVSFVIPMLPDLEQIKQKMKSRTRQLINQALRDSVIADLGLDQLNDYYPVYARAMKCIGTPTLGRSFFESMATQLPKGVDLVSVHYDNKIIGGGFIAPFKQTVYCLWSGMLREHYDLHLSHLLYWEVIKYAHECGYQNVDLGRCKENSGGYVFKKSFGGHAERLYQQVYMNGKGIPPTVGAEMAEDVKYRLFTSIWRRLPQGMTEVLGPKLRKQIPFG